jgi:lysophospholipid acyltransferase
LDNVTPSKIELSPEHRSIINNWNKTVQSWLHADVFMPIHAQYGSTLASIATYTISAFWHGMFPGYYFAFLSGALMTIAEKSNPDISVSIPFPLSTLHRLPLLTFFLLPRDLEKA